MATSSFNLQAGQSRRDLAARLPFLAQEKSGGGEERTSNIDRRRLECLCSYIVANVALDDISK